MIIIQMFNCEYNRIEQNRIEFGWLLWNWVILTCNTSQHWALCETMFALVLAGPTLCLMCTLTMLALCCKKHLVSVFTCSSLLRGEKVKFWKVDCISHLFPPSEIIFPLYLIIYILIYITFKCFKYQTQNAFVLNHFLWQHTPADIMEN